MLDFAPIFTILMTLMNKIIAINHKRTLLSAIM